MDKDERKKLEGNIGKVFCKRAKAARSGDNAQLTMKAYSRLNEGKSTETEVQLWVYLPSNNHPGGRGSGSEIKTTR